jgi:CBS domain-containing protein
MSTSARDVMTEEVEVVGPDDSIRSVLERLARADFNGFPVVDENDELVGIVTQGDLVRLFRARDRVVWIPIGVPPFSETIDYAFDLSLDRVDLGIEVVRKARRPISTVMTENVVTVAPDASLDDLLAILGDEERDINRVPVVEDGHVVGIVTREDLLRAIRKARVG